ncbi:glycosyltransferase family 2 protein [Niastella sp. OAS944]|uniref:glycosyltransferase family 2 protein n=1 Tax=Niastella sp. OAS944 TaxID=2664089 RepID=UPI00346DE0EB|nr:glycosyltransferase involved in cell wall biosynthesis [Chitinophagaceae bacterium OAS944]
MTDFPKISVITPSYNQGQFIEETILSVIGQNYPNLEYIVIDGGSTDNTVSIIKKYESKISYWVSEKDGGQAEAINKGFKKATGDIFCWLNSDDMFMPGALYIMAAKMKENNSAIYFGNCIHFKYANDGVEAIGSNVVEAARLYSLQHVDFIIQPSSFWSKATFEKVGYLTEELHFGLDWQWFLRAKQCGVPFIAIQECLSMYRAHPNHKSSHGGKKRQSEFVKIYDQYAPERTDLYKQVCEDSATKASGVKHTLLKVYFKLTGKPYNNGEVLKTLKPVKYSKYSKQAIQECTLML